MPRYRAWPWLLVLFAIINGTAPAFAQGSDDNSESGKLPSIPPEQTVAQSTPPSSVEADSAAVVPSGESPSTQQPAGEKKSGAGQPSSKVGQEAPQTGPSEEPESAKQNTAPDSGAKDGASKLSFGLGLGLINQPEESSLESNSTPIELYTEYSQGPWLGFRAGYNQAGSKLGATTLESTAIYIGYRISQAFFQSVEAFALIGLTQISSTLTLGTGESRGNSGLGTVFGGGAAYRFGSLLLGGQLIIFSRSGDFGGIAIAAGSNQLQLTAAYTLF